jgi:hypothetical protein
MTREKKNTNLSHTLANSTAQINGRPGSRSFSSRGDGSGNLDSHKDKGYVVPVL